MITRRNLTAAERERAVHAPFACATGTVLEMRAGGVKLAAESDAIKELLRAAVAREQVALEVDLVAYEQERGKRNYNCFRFKDGAMPSLGKSGEGTIYLRDHQKWNSEAVIGRITASRTERVAEGHYRILQTALITEPAAVERALRGLMGAVSIGAWASGPVICSHCETEVLEECWHWPGDVIKGTDGAPDEVAEWVYTAAVLKETSEVPIGAVPTAGVTTIRAAIEAAIHGGAARNALVDHSGLACGESANSMSGHTGGASGALVAAANPHQHRKPMNDLRKALAAKLNLDATAGDEAFVSAVEDLLGDRAELAITQAELKASTVSVVDTFIRDALASGRIAPTDEPMWREFYAASPERAAARMAKRPANAATPVGQPSQRDAVEPTEASAAAAAQNAVSARAGGNAGRDAQARQLVEATSVDGRPLNYDRAVAFAKAFGAKDPRAAVAKHVAGIEQEGN